MSLEDPAWGDLLPLVSNPLRGPRGDAQVELLAASECPGLTARRRRRAEASGADHDPIVLRAARRANVLDVDGNRYVDLVAGFGAALIGHTHPAVVSTVRAQSERLLHALGDVYPSEEKILLEARLAAMAPWQARVILGLSGADAVEAALKTARLATGRPGVLAFTGGYHGLSYGTVALCGYKDAFREPFAGQLNPAVRFAPFPDARDASLDRALDAVDNALQRNEIGAVVVEPILGRGGVVVPHARFLPELAARAKAHGALLIADEIYTGLGRVGPRFRAVAAGVAPDVICVGKALGGGVPVSACLMREDVARAWGTSSGEAIHTSTFLGNPLACAAALATLDVLDAPETHRAIDAASRALRGAIARACDAMPDASLSLHGEGLLVGVGLGGGSARALAVARALLERGFITLLGGVQGDGLTLTPPMTLTPAQADAFGAALVDVLRAAPPEPVR